MFLVLVLVRVTPIRSLEILKNITKRILSIACLSLVTITQVKLQVKFK